MRVFFEDDAPTGSCRYFFGIFDYVLNASLSQLLGIVHVTDYEQMAHIVAGQHLHQNQFTVVFELFQSE